MIALLKQADTAVLENRLDDYFAIRKQMDDLTDEEKTTPGKNLTAPNRAPRTTGTWRDDADDSELVFALQNNLTNQALKLDHMETATELIRRGYTESEMFSAEHFGIDKHIGGNDYYDFAEIHVSDLTSLSNAAGEQYGVTIPRERVQAIARENFGAISIDPVGHDHEDFAQVGKSQVQAYSKAILQEAKKMKSESA